MLPFSTADLELARRLEAAEAANGFAMACGTAEAESICGGCALFAGAGSPMTHALGIGMAGPTDDDEFERLERFFHSRGSASLIDLCPMAHPTVIGQVTRRGYKVIEFNNLMLRRAEPPCSQPPGVFVSSAGAVGRDEWMRLIMRGFNNGLDPAPEMLAMMGALPAVDCELFADVDDGHGGGAAMSIRGGVALLFGDATLPEARGRGVQQALIGHRLRLASEAGCEWAMASVLPGSGSHRNYERMGFGLAYMRVNVMREA